MERQPVSNGRNLRSTFGTALSLLLLHVSRCFRGLSLAAVGKHVALRKLGFYPGVIPGDFAGRASLGPADQNRCQIPWLWGFPSQFLLFFFKVFSSTLLQIVNRMGFVHLYLLTHLIFFIEVINSLGKTLDNYK